MLHRNPLSIGFQLRHRAQHCTTILYKHRFMPTLHINVAHISISQAYYFIAICYQSDHSIPLLYKTLIFSNIISTSISRHTDNTRALYPSHNTACFVTARLAVQLNVIVQNHSTCRFVVTTQLHFPKPSTIMLVVAKVFSKTVVHNSYRLILYIGILKVMDILQSCAQPQGYFRCHQLRLFCTTVSCKSSTVVHFLYGVFSKRIVL